MSGPSRREQLLGLAEQTLEREGLEGLGITALAREAGIKPPSLYKHFAGIDEIENALIARGLRAVGATMADALTATPGATPRARLEAFARAYRANALARPQLYRLTTARPLDRAALEAGAEHAGMAAVLELFGETVERRDRARAAWAWAHGLVTLEIAGRFPDDADLDAAWTVLVDGLLPFVVVA